MVNSCYLCDRKASQADNISLHRFPKNLDVRIKWLNACGLTINDDVRRTCICSRHFKAEDICQSNIFGIVKSSIKRNAVPSVYVKNPININTSNKPQSNTPLSDLFNGNGVFHPLSYILEKSSEKNKSLSQCQKRKFFEPRYVSEISPTDFSTPKKAKITIDLIKKTDKRKTKNKTATETK